MTDTPEPVVEEPVEEETPESVVEELVEEETPDPVEEPVEEETPEPVEEETEEKKEPSILIIHARRELEAIGENPESIECYICAIQAIADLGQPETISSVVIPTITALIEFKNLSPLTDSPDEWNYISDLVCGEYQGVWQNVRNTEVFSVDGGKTRYSLHQTEKQERRSLSRTVNRNVED